MVKKDPTKVKRTQENTMLEDRPIWLMPIVIAFLIPNGICFLVVLGLQLKKHEMLSWFHINQERKAKALFNEDSIHAFIFSDDRRTKSAHVITFIFLITTDSREKNSDRPLNMRCWGDSIECTKSFS